MDILCADRAKNKITAYTAMYLEHATLLMLKELKKNVGNLTPVTLDCELASTFHSQCAAAVAFCREDQRHIAVAYWRACIERLVKLND